MNRHQLTTAATKALGEALGIYDISRAYNTDLLNKSTSEMFDAIREVLTIKTIQQLNLLPEGSTVRSETDDIGNIYVKYPEHYLASLYGEWFSTGYEVPHPADEIPLPARLLFHPGWETK